MAAVALIVAAGSGERLGADRPKAFVVVAGKPLYQWSLETVREAGLRPILALPAGESVDGVECVVGGATRSESVRNALAAAPPETDHIVVHDAARPLAPAELFTRCLAALEKADAAIAAVPVADTIKEVGPAQVVQRTLDRSRLWAIQTPQAFRRAALERALHVRPEVLAQATDDAWLVERSGGRVVVVEAEPGNFKVTTAFDMEMAERFLQR